MTQLELTPLPAPDAKQEFFFEQRWKFLYPSAKHAGDFQLYAPDLMELRWSVYDSRRHITIAFGQTPEEATDAAMHAVETRLKRGVS